MQDRRNTVEKDIREGKNTKGEGKQKEFINNPMLPDPLPDKRKRKIIKEKP